MSRSPANPPLVTSALTPRARVNEAPSLLVMRGSKSKRGSLSAERPGKRFLSRDSADALVEGVQLRPLRLRRTAPRGRAGPQTRPAR